MDLNSLIFGLIIVVSIIIFLYVGRFRASESQRNRKKKIKWFKR